MNTAPLFFRIIAIVSIISIYSCTGNAQSAQSEFSGKYAFSNTILDTKDTIEIQPFENYYRVIYNNKVAVDGHEANDTLVSKFGGTSKRNDDRSAEIDLAGSFAFYFKDGQLYCDMTLDEIEKQSFLMTKIK